VPLNPIFFFRIRPKLFFYNLLGLQKKKKGFRHWLKTKVGEPPVLYSKVDLEYTKEYLKIIAKTMGISPKLLLILPDTAKKATATYTVIPKRYTIRTVQFPQDSPYC
jgi:hypothetical protein